MDRIEIETTDSPTIKINHVAGNLRLKGWDRAAIRADCDRENAQTIDQSADSVTISTTSGCMLRVPMEATIQIGEIDGDLMIKSAEGEITVEKINGQVMAKSIGSMDLSLVNGAINAKGIEGDFSCNQSRGNINLQDIDGKVVIKQSNGNLVVKGYCGGLSAQVDGSANLKIDTGYDQPYKVSSKSSIYCRLMPEVDAAITMESQAKHIKVQQGDQSETLKSANHQVITGQGSTKIALEADANIELIIPGENEFDWEFELNLEKDLSTMAEDITMVVTEQLENQLDTLGDHLNNLSENLSSLNPEISENTRIRIEAKRAKLERKLAKVERRAAEKSRQASRKITRKFTINTPQSDPVSDEERQKVLQMLQNKLISVEEAEALLAALEGN